VIITQKEQEFEVLRLRYVELERGNSVVAELQSRLRQLADENQRLGGLLTDKDKEFNVIRVKLGQLAEENQRLNVVITERIRISEEWEVKYSGLERLYIAVRETTIELDQVKRRYEEACDNTERLDPNLSRLSASTNIKGSYKPQFAGSFLSRNESTFAGATSQMTQEVEVEKKQVYQQF